VTSGRRRRSRPGLRNRRARGCSGQKWPQIARKRMISAPNAAFRVDRSPSLCSAGRFDIIELLHGDLHRLRRPQGARHSPKASRPRSGEWSPRPFTAASGPRSRFVRPVRPSKVPTAAAGGWIAAESALERLQGRRIAHFHLKALPYGSLEPIHALSCLRVSRTRRGWLSGKHGRPAKAGYRACRSKFG
jgi:hypothetical protein